MKKFLVFIFLCGFNTAVFAQTLTRYTADPAAGTLGFARAHWANSINRMIVFFGPGNVMGDNSVRAFDPATNRWEYLWPNDYKNGGLHNRDNYASLYVHRLDELWVWGGSYLELFQQKTGTKAFWSGRFHVSKKKWLTVATDGSAFKDVVANFGGYLLDNGTAWSAEADMGMIFGGSEEGNPSNRYWIIEPNSGGQQPYKMSEVKGGPRPSPRDQCMNCLVAVGRDFYLFGGHTGNAPDGRWIAPPDLWKFNSSTRTWTQLPDAPGSAYQSTLTYDSSRNSLVVWAASKIYVFDLATQKWSDQTPASLPCIFNQVGIFAPTVNASLFEGGNRCSDGGSPGLTVYGIRLGGKPTSVAPVAAPVRNQSTTPTASAAAVSVPASTLKALDLGVTGEDKVGPVNQTKSNGKPDFHISVSGLRGKPNSVTITSDTGGIWETPFNGTNWIIAAQYDSKGNGDFWFEQLASNSFRVKASYADGTIDETDALKRVSNGSNAQSASTTVSTNAPAAVASPITPSTSTSTLKALDLGVTGEDKVGPVNQTKSNGKPDFHISVSGLRGNPNSVTITSDTGGIWETPFNGTNWIIAAQYDGKGNGDFWFEQLASNSFRVKVNYSDGTTDESDAFKRSSKSPMSPSTPTAVPANTSAPTPSSTTVSSSTKPSIGTTSSSGGLTIPLRTWIARRFNTPNAPAAGFKGAGGVGSKHLRLAQNPNNGRIYFNGGDYSVKPDVGNSWYGLWSYDVLTDKWLLEYPWCGKSGEIMPTGRDEVGWVWDSKRNVFWSLPGFVQQSTWRCPPGSGTEEFGILTFDPVSKKWSNPNAAAEPVSGQKPKNAIYDPQTDSIYRSGIGSTGVGWTVYNIGTNTWKYYETSHAADGTYINNSELAFEYLAADLPRRKIYAIDPVYYRLFEFDMDRHTISIKAPIPEPNPARIAQSRNLQWTLKDFTMPVFDSVNNVLLYPYINALDDGRPKLLIYHPDKNTWETDPMYQPDGLTVRGNSFTFDPIHNVLISFGGLAPGGDADPSVTHFFLYRYGNGSSQHSK